LETGLKLSLYLKISEKRHLIENLKENNSKKVSIFSIKFEFIADVK
jgi:hypothetical protein